MSAKRHQQVPVNDLSSKVSPTPTENRRYHRPRSRVEMAACAAARPGRHKTVKDTCSMWTSVSNKEAQAHIDPLAQTGAYSP